MERKLASIQKIIKIDPIPGADKIEKAQVLGWQCIVPKGTFKENDLCIYVEIDSLVPKAIWSNFLWKEGDPHRYRRHWEISRRMRPILYHQDDESLSNHVLRPFREDQVPCPGKTGRW